MAIPALLCELIAEALRRVLIAWAAIFRWIGAGRHMGAHLVHELRDRRLLAKLARSLSSLERHPAPCPFLPRLSWKLDLFTRLANPIVGPAADIDRRERLELSRRHRLSSKICSALPRPRHPLESPTAIVFQQSVVEKVLDQVLHLRLDADQRCTLSRYGHVTQLVRDMLEYNGAAFGLATRNSLQQHLPAFVKWAELDLATQGDRRKIADALRSQSQHAGRVFRSWMSWQHFQLERQWKASNQLLGTHRSRFLSRVSVSKVFADYHRQRAQVMAAQDGTRYMLAWEQHLRAVTVATQIFSSVTLLQSKRVHSEAEYALTQILFQLQQSFEQTFPQKDSLSDPMRNSSQTRCRHVPGHAC